MELFLDYNTSLNLIEWGFAFAANNIGNRGSRMNAIRAEIVPGAFAWPVSASGQTLRIFPANSNLNQADAELTNSKSALGGE